jgi:acetyltransferase-like isoleucine patch superfamily enzyme
VHKVVAIRAAQKPVPAQAGHCLTHNPGAILHPIDPIEGTAMSQVSGRFGETVIDPGVQLDYRSGRRLEYQPSQIGPGAHIRTNTIIYANVCIGAGLETGHNVVIREENTIGLRFRIWNNSVVDYGCTIGDDVRVHCNVYIAQYTVIEDDVFLAPGVVIANDLHPICTRDMRGPTIRARARVGCNATLLPRIVIGFSALIGAGSVVTDDVPDRMVVAGNPARVICSVDQLQCRTGRIDQPYVDGLDVLLRENLGLPVEACPPATRSHS